jgi:membrane-associated phospholipid phosphatase
MTRGARLACAALAMTLHAVLYGLANKLPLTTPAFLPLTAVDRAVPFLPWTVWLYTSDYLLVLVAFVLCRRTEQAVRFLAAFAAAVVGAVAVQWVLPVAYPRDLYPLPTPPGPSEWLALLVRTVDSPLSCFPSLHVGLAFVCAQAARRADPAGRRAVDWRWLGLMAWATGIAASTLTFKQHYLVDVAGGLALAVGVTALVERLLTPARCSAAAAWLTAVASGTGPPAGAPALRFAQPRPAPLSGRLQPQPARARRPERPRRPPR